VGVGRAGAREKKYIDACMFKLAAFSC
jgi:hypothetical protein